MLTHEDIATLLELLAHEAVIEPSKKFPYRVTREARGYSDDPATARLQAKLSIMLEAARG